MLKAKAALLISAFVSLTGCVGVGSLHPLALPDGNEAVFDPALPGSWEEADAADDVAAARYAIARADFRRTWHAFEQPAFPGTAVKLALSGSWK